MPTKILYLLISMGVFWIAAAHASDLTIDEQSIDFGEKYQFDVFVHDVRIWNRSAMPVRLSAHPSNAKWPPLTFDSSLLAAGESTLVHVKVPLENRSGVIVARLPFDAEVAGKSETNEIAVSGYVDSILDVARPALEFGVVDAQAKPVEKTVQLTSSTDPALRITSVLEKPDFASVRIVDGTSLQISAAKFDILGFSKGIIKVALNSKIQPQAWITVVMDIHGNVVPDQNPVDFGMQRESSAHPVRVQLTSRDGKPFHVGKVALGEAGHIAVDAMDCLPKARDDCHAYQFAIKPDHPHGPVFGKVSFELPDSHQVLNIHLGGMFFSDSMKVQSLNGETSNAATATESKPARTETLRATDLAESLKKAVASQKEAATPPGSGPVLKWNIANEAGIFGYAIYRGDTVDGHFARVNTAIVKAQNGGDNINASYEWRDVNATAGREYWYYITIFYNDGRKQQLTGPQKVIAK